MTTRNVLQRGFTLVELMVVVAIIGILASIGIPAMIKYIRTAETSEPTQRLGDLAKNIQGYVDSRPNISTNDLGTSLSGKLLNASCATTAGNTCINYYIPQIQFASTSNWAYKVEAMTVDATTRVATLCLGAKHTDATKLGAVYYSSTVVTTDASWQGNTHVASYVNSVAASTSTVTAVGGCTSATINDTKY